jgi:GTPase SAR1 family protein
MTPDRSYTNLKKRLLKINESLSSVVSRIQSNWHKACSSIRLQISEDVLRIAVVGPIKSGKSTLINSLFGGDYLKRGAGVVTSIVTRIQNGEHMKAVLFFKSWDEINTEISSALDLIPLWSQKTGQETIDIRDEKDRDLLRSVLEGLSDDLLVSEGVRTPASMTLSLFLNGFSRVNEVISSDSFTTEFSGDRFPRHQEFSGDDSLAVYLKDMELYIPSDNIDTSIEIADCQGSDSLNPLHSAMIQDYLLKTHLIVYVISSRTGLRQADLRFLSVIKKMGILKNILFVVNSDFSEHASLEDLNTTVDKIRKEIALIRPEPKIYTFSALFNLFNTLSAKLSKKDNLRFAQWKTDEDMVAISIDETERFTETLNEKLSRERFNLLSEHHLDRMGVISSGIEQWAWMSREFLQQDTKGTEELRKKIERYQNRTGQIKSQISNTLKGSTENLTKELKTDIDRFFGTDPKGLLGQTVTITRQYTVSMEKYRDKLLTKGFSHTLHLVFHDFKHSLSAFIGESIDPQIIRFSSAMEERIKTNLELTAAPFQAMVSDVVTELKVATGKPVPESLITVRSAQPLLDIDAIKARTGLHVPLSTVDLHYSYKMKSEAYARLGLYSTIKFLRKIVKKPEKDDQAAQITALDRGLRRIKNEAEEYLVFHFENFRENFKFQYLLKFLNKASEHLHSLLMERFQSYEADMQTMENVVDKKGHEREEIIHFLENTTVDVQRIQGEIEKERKRLGGLEASEQKGLEDTDQKSPPGSDSLQHDQTPP